MTSISIITEDRFHAFKAAFTFTATSLVVQLIWKLTPIIASAWNWPLIHSRKWVAFKTKYLVDASAHLAEGLWVSLLRMEKWLSLKYRKKLKQICPKIYNFDVVLKVYVWFFHAQRRDKIIHCKQRWFWQAHVGAFCLSLFDFNCSLSSQSQKPILVAKSLSGSALFSYPCWEGCRP